MTRTKLLVLALFSGPLACSSSGNVNIGNTQQLGGKLSDYAAQWDGYAEAYTFQPSGSDHVRLTLDADGNGTVQVGTDALLPVPTDPSLGFPVGENIPTAGSASNLSGGVLYPVYAAQVQTNRIQFGLKPNDFWKVWCELQTSYRIASGWTSQRPDGGEPFDAGLSPDGGGPGDGGLYPVWRYTCVPGFAGYSPTSAGAQCFTEDDTMIRDVYGTGPYQDVDCGKYVLCQANVCACNETGCGSWPTIAASASPPQYPVELDGSLDSSGKNLTGTLNIAGTRVTVHLQRP